MKSVNRQALLTIKNVHHRGSSEHGPDCSLLISNSVHMRNLAEWSSRAVGTAQTSALWWYWDNTHSSEPSRNIRRHPSLPME